MSKVFFTSDLHFGHENVIKFDKRPFKTVEEMNAELIKRWNSKVGVGDIVYVLGDFIWRMKADEAHALIKSLNGQIILIKGNHDRFLHNSNVKNALGGVKDYDDISVKLEHGAEPIRCILSHYFMPMYNGHFRKAIHLHGHSHNSKEHFAELQIANSLNKAGFRCEAYNVGCMHWDYEPVTLDEILAGEGRTILPCYKPLWKMLIDLDMTQEDLLNVTGISKTTLRKMKRDEPISFMEIEKIKETLHCKEDNILYYLTLHEARMQDEADKDIKINLDNMPDLLDE